MRSGRVAEALRDEKEFAREEKPRQKAVEGLHARRPGFFRHEPVPGEKQQARKRASHRDLQHRAHFGRGRFDRNLLQAPNEAKRHDDGYGAGIDRTTVCARWVGTGFSGNRVRCRDFEVKVKSMLLCVPLCRLGGAGERRRAALFHALSAGPRPGWRRRILGFRSDSL